MAHQKVTVVTRFRALHNDGTESVHMVNKCQSFVSKMVDWSVAPQPQIFHNASQVSHHNHPWWALLTRQCRAPSKKSIIGLDFDSVQSPQWLREPSLHSHLGNHAMAHGASFSLANGWGASSSRRSAAAPKGARPSAEPPVVEVPWAK